MLHLGRGDEGKKGGRLQLSASVVDSQAQGRKLDIKTLKCRVRATEQKYKKKTSKHFM